MTFDQILLDLKIGFKFRRESWSEDFYIYKRGNNIYSSESDEQLVCLYTESILANDWRLYEE